MAPRDEHTPVLSRCKACSAYLNAYARLDERAMRWECNLCGEPAFASELLREQLGDIMTSGGIAAAPDPEE